MRTDLFRTVSFALATAFAATTGAHGQSTAIIIDSTALMAGKLGQSSKIDIVKAAVAGAAKRGDANSPFALWAFGSQPTQKCEDAREISVSSNDDTAQGSGETLSSLQPKPGRAAISTALRTALKAAGADTVLKAVVIAGADDDCNPDLCGTARALQAIYPKTKISFIGIGAAKPVAERFACAAKAFGGTFAGVKNRVELDKALGQALSLTASVAQKQTDSPKPVKSQPSPEAAPKPQSAPDAAPKGQTSAEAGPKGQKSPEVAPKADPAPAQVAETMNEGEDGKDPDESDASAASTEPKKEAAPEVRVTTQPEPEPNVILSATLAPGQPPLESGVTWRITRVQTTPTGQLRLADVPTWTGGGGVGKTKLPEGRYGVDVSYGFSTAQSEFSVGTGKVEMLIPINAGTVAAKMSPPLDAAGSETLVFTLYPTKPGAAVTEVGRSSTDPALFHVNAGEYRLVAASGLIRHETRVSVQAGKVSAVTIPTGVGILNVKAFAAEGQPKLVPAFYRLYSAGANAKATPLLTIAGPAGRVQVPAGSYRLQTTYGQATLDSAVIVTAGQITTQSVILNAGEASIKAGIEKGIADPTKLCAIYPASATSASEPVARAAGATVSFILAAGEYEAECRKKGAIAGGKRTPIHIKAGETHSVDMSAQ